MGTLTYNGSIRVDFDDRLLMHLQLVIAAKLRRDESFLFSWTRSDEHGGGRTAVWVDRHVPIVFEYASSVMSPVNRQWAGELTDSTYLPSGMQITPEPGGVLEGAGPAAAVSDRP